MKIYGEVEDGSEATHYRCFKCGHLYPRNGPRRSYYNKMLECCPKCNSVEKDMGTWAPGIPKKDQNATILVVM